MRVAVLSTFGETCGIATYSEALYGALAKLGVSVEVCAPFLAPGDSPRDKQPRRLWGRHRATLPEAARTFRALRELKPDLVHIQFNLGLFSPRFLGTVLALCRAARLPVLTTVHARGGGDRRRRKQLFYSMLALRAGELLVHDAAHMRGVYEGKLHVIPHGVEPVVPRTVAQARSELGLEILGPLVAHFGFLTPDKGVLEALRELSTLRAERFPGLVYLVSGGTFPGAEGQNYLAEVRALAVSLGMSDALRMTGQFVPEERVVPEMQAADLIVLNHLTGNSQGSSGAARRALSSGRPVLVSSAPVFDDLRSAVHTVSGSLSDEVAHFLSDADARAAVAERARAFCEAHSWQRVAEQHLELYQRLLAGEARR